ncbi:MAG: porin [Rhizobiales bacterium]|nr:porin [Hyphomicrobiales bacterium]
MNVKAFLFSSAALLAGLPAARAADAVVMPEPESVEYVRVCDVYGAGYFYIPGTETCLKIGGYVQYDIGGGDLFARHPVDHQDGGTNDAWFQRTRFVLETFTGAETELGTLKTYTQVRVNWQNGGGTSVALRQAWADLAGLRMGKIESNFGTFIGNISNVVTDDILPYAPYDTNAISYTFTSGGFSGIVALEEGGSDSGLGDGSRYLAQNTHNYTIDSYVPHIVAGAKYKTGWGGIGIVGGYDSVHDKFTVKGRVDVKFNDRFSAYVMAGWGDNDLEADADAGRLGRFNYYKPWSGEWAVWAGMTATLTEKAKFNALLAYDDAEEFAAVANVDYTLVPGFRVIPELVYKDGGKAVNTDAWGGWVRFRRSF